MNTGEKYLITADSWFYAPDGKTYKAAWGTVAILGDDALGIKTNRNSTNWYAQIGSGDRHIIIAGCEIHYAVRCESPPSSGPGESWKLIDGGMVVGETPCSIYFADDVIAKSE